MTKLLRFLRPSHQHTAFSATLLMMMAVMLSRVIGYAREASITFISIYTRFLAEKREADAQKTFSIVITVMTTALVVGTILAEIFAPEFVHWFVKDFKPDQIALCARLTRILLPAQIFFYVGGVVSAILISHRLFLLPAFGPIIYNLFIIVGGVIGGRHFGIASLAYGALIGSVAGPFLASVIGAAKIGTGYRPSFDVTNPAFREWVRLSIPLMLGVSLVTADDWILRHYASGGVGDITRLTFAKRLFAVPIAVLGQATGQASLPFFARLFNEKRLKEFAGTVNDSVYRVAAASFLASAWMMVAALPLIDLVYRRGKFLFVDSQTSAIYFFWFSLSLVLWSAQGLYARAFYAAGDTLTPMVAVSVITLASMPVYSILFHTFGVIGLAWASDIGIGMNLLALAWLLHYRKLSRLGDLRWNELGKATLTAAVAGGISFEVAKAIPLATGQGSRGADFLQLGLVSVTWAAAVAAGLWLLRSELPRDLRNRK